MRNGGEMHRAGGAINLEAVLAGLEHGQAVQRRMGIIVFQRNGDRGIRLEPLFAHARAIQRLRPRMPGHREGLIAPLDDFFVHVPSVPHA